MTKRTYKLLVIDDDTGMIRLLEKRLKSQGYSVVGALSGEDGVQKAKQSPPDLVLLDIMMPRMSGAEVARKFQSDDDLKAIPIVFITVTISKKDDKVPKQVEIDGVLYEAFAKPLYFPKLISVINKLIRKSTRGDEAAN